MSKATLSFTLPEEQEDFDSAYNGASYLLTLSEIYNKCRSQLKYGSPLSPEEADKFIEEIKLLAVTG